MERGLSPLLLQQFPTVWSGVLDSLFERVQPRARGYTPGRSTSHMPTKPKGEKERGKPRNQEIIQTLAARSAPIVNPEKVIAASANLRPQHPELSDDTVALCVEVISTQSSIRAICKRLGCSFSWAATRMRQPATQRFLQELAMTTLGVAAVRSIKTLEQLRDKSTDESMRFRASQELMDRAGLGNTTQQREAGAAPGYAFSFASTKQPTQ